MTNLLLIESPGKVKKLGQILGSGWVIKASMGHVRELANDGEDALGFDLGANSIDCRYQPRDARAKKVLSDLRQAVKAADCVYIATDPDREGETIGWHLQQALNLKNPRRVVYSEITAQAVRAAIARPRTLDQSLVAAGRARDCLDKLVGYKGSRHVVWPLNNGAKSMGRVQSATLHLLCARERAIQAFVPQDYWSVWVTYGEGFKAFYRSSPKPQRKSAKDAEDQGTENESERVTSQERADQLVAIARANPHHVLHIEGKQTTQSPPAPFVTSTLQQAAGSKLHFSPEHTMKVAQALYEKGHITYMRTDSITLSAPFCDAVRQYLEQHDPTNLPRKTTQHRAIKGSQEAHEAIRPTDVNHLPQHLQRELSAEQARLYELIWNRAVASQCAPARLRKTRIVTQAGDAYWEARGQVLEFAGYTRYWNNLSADSVLPALTQGQLLQLDQAQADAKQTQPPPRYSEPKLVKLMEQKGIGRPSTYAPTIKTLREREYVDLLQGKLQPTALGLELDGALEKLLPDLIQPEFTAQMETALDAIATGDQEWQAYLLDWNRGYFAPAIAQAKSQLLSLPTFAEHAPVPGAVSLERSPVTTAKPTTGQPTKTKCPTCGEAMTKLPSRSKKMKAKHFLKCSGPGCGTVMFWNAQAKRYELPQAQRQSLNSEMFTDHPCPICGALLERYAYTKEGQDKVMLRCSILENRRGKCKEVAFFQSRGEFWSPKFGTLKLPAPSP
ncbi:type I DNA topoisomerase [Phormidium tenue]|uniref:DNA topoisomerase 1 n=1 Tax=Phormidium tenue NIES-30 TaxID=549789 RepID=A0A1U7IZL3_9CYAN|nr:type I DNA topoisomerase [Phormidium tenue]MBD2234464.1 type I DNA topoisomerase [Phormidium tenue FACHB-1052]OKH44438.1 DNA topoisomerase I [Phormidium tenue NIES-30]